MRVSELEVFEMLLKALNLVQDQCQLQTTGKIKKMYLGFSFPNSCPLAIRECASQPDTSFFVSYLPLFRSL